LYIYFETGVKPAQIEFCEVASMAMELLGNEFLEEFYSTPEANRARKTHLEGLIGFFPWMRFSIGSTLTPATRTPSARRRICRPLTASAAMWIFPATKKSVRIPGTGSFIFFCIRFNMSNTASRS
jgi:hypothetical protein